MGQLIFGNLGRITSGIYSFACIQLSFLEVIDYILNFRNPFIKETGVALGLLQIELDLLGARLNEIIGPILLDAFQVHVFGVNAPDQRVLVYPQ